MADDVTRHGHRSADCEIDPGRPSAIELSDRPSLTRDGQMATTDKESKAEEDEVWHNYAGNFSKFAGRVSNLSPPPPDPVE
ncbi:unnamed protein product [Nippostrongylus brasiliensis]|uniref:DUF397 domain-containing protein n=1 Tax=Nippostrongylus brasiliensis TaxID=27835 RepID=A0A0N4YLZ5_NIPBR|nr:unnamed protein product [Nippostrongylus brasiliensis]